MAKQETKAQRAKRLSREDAGWAKVIKSSGKRLRERFAQTKKDNHVRAAAIENLPLDDIFHEHITQTTSPVSDVIREMIQAGKDSGLRESPDAVMVALVRAANYWYEVAKSRQEKT